MPLHFVEVFYMKGVFMNKLKTYLKKPINKKYKNFKKTLDFLSNITYTNTR